MSRFGGDSLFVLLLGKVSHDDIQTRQLAYSLSAQLCVLSLRAAKIIRIVAPTGRVDVRA